MIALHSQGSSSGIGKELALNLWQVSTDPLT